MGVRAGGFTSQPVRIKPLSDWEATEQLAFDYIPSLYYLQDGEVVASGYYSGAELRDALERIIERWGDRAFEIRLVKFNIGRLGLDSLVQN